MGPGKTPFHQPWARSEARSRPWLGVTGPAPCLTSNWHWAGPVTGEPGSPWEQGEGDKDQKDERNKETLKQERRINDGVR